MHRVGAALVTTWTPRFNVYEREPKHSGKNARFAV
jgi:hypothetical protein